MKNLLIIDNTTPKNSSHSYNGKVSTLMYSVGSETRLENIIKENLKKYDNIFIISEYAEQLKELAEFKSLLTESVNIFNKANFDFNDYDVKYLMPQSDNEFERNMVIFHTNNVSRYFNSIEIKDEVVYKKAITDKGVKLQNIEGEYYNTFRNIPSLCPMLGWDKETHTLLLKKLNAKTCTEYIKENPLKAVYVYNKFVEATNKLHSVKINITDSKQDCEVALRNELINMIGTRIRPCKKLIESLGKIDTFNNMPVTNYESLIKMLNNWFEYYKENAEFCLVHGDPNTDNCMYDEENDEVYFIDPRGYFGSLKTLGYGLRDYDYAKFLYGMTGYSQFNNAPYINVKLENNNVDVKIDNKSISTFDLDKLTDNLNLKILVSIIWIKLTSYIINDPIKSVAAYYYGNALLTRYLKEFFETHQ